MVHLSGQPVATVLGERQAVLVRLVRGLLVLPEQTAALGRRLRFRPKEDVAVFRWRAYHASVLSRAYFWKSARIGRRFALWPLYLSTRLIELLMSLILESFDATKYSSVSTGRIWTTFFPLSSETLEFEHLTSLNKLDGLQPTDTSLRKCRCGKSRAACRR